MEPFRLALSNAEVKARTIGIRLIRAVVGFVFIVQWTVIKVVVAVGRDGLLSPRPNGSARQRNCGPRNKRNGDEPKPSQHGKYPDIFLSRLRAKAVIRC